jgi:hypothetical protein
VGGSWSEIKKVGSVGGIFTTATFVDSSLKPGSYEYRVRAYKGQEIGPYSEAFQVLMIGYAYINITSPAAGDKYLAGTDCYIEWEANLVNEIVLEYSTDDGITWQPITAAKNVLKTDPDWGKYVWTLPGAAATGVIVRAYRYSDLNMIGISEKFDITNDPSDIRPCDNSMHASTSVEPVVYDLFDLSGRKISSITTKRFADIQALKRLPYDGVIIIRRRGSSATTHKALNIKAIR